MQVEKPLYVSYENYNQTSQNYDKSRRAIGLDEIDRLLQEVAQKKGVEVKDLILLDAGCGSGNYTKHVYQKVKKYIGVEFNDGMVEKFKAKYQGIDAIELVQTSIFDTGLESEIADVIIMNQVIHHLDSENKVKTDQELRDIGYPNISKTMNELYRLLKPNGAISVNFTPIEQMFGLWYIKHLHPKEKTEDVWCKICPDKEQLRSILEKIGFKELNFVPIKEPFMYRETYLQLEGPMHKEFRDGDSFWGLITADEVQQCLEKLKKLLEGDRQQLLKQYEDELNQIGQSTTCSAYKISNA